MQHQCNSFVSEQTETTYVHMAFEDELSDENIAKKNIFSDLGQRINRCIDSTNGKIKDTRVILN